MHSGSSSTRYPQTVLVSCEIPWDENEHLLDAVFRLEIQRVLRHFSDLYIFGTAGEGYAIDMPRFKEIVRIFFEETHGTSTQPSVRPMVGIMGLSTLQMIEKIAFAYDVGFRIFQLSLPSWGTVTDSELMRFFAEICGQFTDCRFLHYNLPRVGRVLTGQEYRPLIDAFPNLVATKTTSGGLPGAAELLRFAPELQHFMGEINFAHGCMVGECSLLASVGPMAPRQTWAFFEAGRNRQVQELFQWQHDFFQMKADVLAHARAGVHMDGAIDKVLKRLGGFEEMPLRLLSPYQGVSEDAYQRCKQIYAANYSHWERGMDGKMTPNTAALPNS